MTHPPNSEPIEHADCEQPDPELTEVESEDGSVVAYHWECVECGETQVAEPIQ